MTWPTGAVSTTNVDATTDDPELGVADIKSAFDKLNQIIAHVSGYIQGLLDDADATAALATLGAAPLASPVFTGDPQAPTPATSDNDTSIATTAFVKAQAYAPLASPVFTGNPTAPTPSGSDNTTKLATTAFVQGELVAKAPLASPSFTGTASFAGLIDASGAAAGQIKFSATQNASANANTLDDYEEGTWTPNVGGTATYFSQHGNYIKIGRACYIEGELTINALGTGAPGIVGGLPFTSFTQSGTQMFIGMGLSTALSISVVEIHGRVGSGGTGFVMRGRPAANVSDADQNVFANATDISFSGTYITAS